MSQVIVIDVVFDIAICLITGNMIVVFLKRKSIITVDNHTGLLIFYGPLPICSFQTVPKLDSLDKMPNF